MSRVKPRKSPPRTTPMRPPPGWQIEDRGDFRIAVNPVSGEEVILHEHQKRDRSKVQAKPGRPATVPPETRKKDARAAVKAALEIIVFREFGQQHAQPSVRQAVAAAVNEQFLNTPAEQAAAEERIRKVVRRLLADREKNRSD